MDTTSWQRVEGAGVFVAAILAVSQVDAGLAWWAAVLIFFAPDLSFAGYLAGARVGAALYNLVHVYAFGAVVIAVGMVWGSDATLAIGLLWLGHSGFARMLGYGLKSPEGFEHTHLGRIGRGRAD